MYTPRLEVEFQALEFYSVYSVPLDVSAISPPSPVSVLSWEYGESHRSPILFALKFPSNIIVTLSVAIVTKLSV